MPKKAKNGQDQQNLQIPLPASGADVLEAVPHLRGLSMEDGTRTRMLRAMHAHDDRLEILLIRKGHGVHTIDGKSYATGEGDLLIYNAGALHDECADAMEGIDVFFLTVDRLKIAGLPQNTLIPAEVCPVVQRHGLEQELGAIMRLMMSLRGTSGGGIDAGQRAAGSAAGQRVAGSAAGQRIAGSAAGQSGAGATTGQTVAGSTAGQTCGSRTDAEALRHLLCALLLTIRSAALRQGQTVSRTEMDLGHRIQHYLDQHFTEDLDLAQAAADLRISRHHLAHVFRRTVGHSPMQYVIRRRIGEAQSLLQNTDANVTDVAMQVGYNSASNFHAAFIKMVGMTPQKYREFWRNAPE